MPIDPVVVLAEELRIAENTLRRACAQRPGEALTGLMARAVSVYKELVETAPTSALGAAELICLVADGLPSSGDAHASKMHEISERLMSGRRLRGDLIWLRAMAQALERSLFGDLGKCNVSILNLAIQGAARPVIVFRSVDLLPEDDRREAGTG
jgi:hypothetical protein